MDDRKRISKNGPKIDKWFHFKRVLANHFTTLFMVILIGAFCYIGYTGTRPVAYVDNGQTKVVYNKDLKSMAKGDIMLIKNEEPLPVIDDVLYAFNLRQPLRYQVEDVPYTLTSIKGKDIHLEANQFTTTIEGEKVIVNSENILGFLQLKTKP